MVWPPVKLKLSAWLRIPISDLVSNRAAGAVGLVWSPGGGEEYSLELLSRLEVEVGGVFPGVHRYHLASTKDEVFLQSVRPGSLLYFFNPNDMHIGSSGLLK